MLPVFVLLATSWVRLVPIITCCYVYLMQNWSYKVILPTCLPQILSRKRGFRLTPSESQSISELLSHGSGETTMMRSVPKRTLEEWKAGNRRFSRPSKLPAETSLPQSEMLPIRTAAWANLILKIS